MRSWIRAFGPCALVASVALHTASGRRWDQRALESHRALPDDWAKDSGVLLISIDRAALLIVAGLVISTGVWWKRRSAEPGAIVLATALTLGFSLILKRTLAPAVVDDALLTGNTLPSGHAAGAAAAVVIGITMLTDTRLGRTHLDGLAATGSAALTGFLALIVLSTGHRVSDVLVAVLLIEAAVAVARGRATSTVSLTAVSIWLLGAVQPFSGSIVDVAASMLAFICVCLVSVGLLRSLTTQHDVVTVTASPTPTHSWNTDVNQVGMAISGRA